MQYQLNQLVTHPALPLAHRLRSPVSPAGGARASPA